MSILFDYCIIPYIKKFYIDLDTIEIFVSYFENNEITILYLWVKEEKGIIIYTKNLCSTKKITLGN